MKIAGMTIPMAPLFETARLPIAVTATMLNPREHDKGRLLTKEVVSALHPGISVAYGLATGKDLSTGKTLPFRGLSQHIYGEHRTQKQTMNVGEYVAGRMPIPAQPILTEMAKQGVPPDLSVPFLRSYAESIFSGIGGTHVYPNVEYKDKALPGQTPAINRIKKERKERLKALIGE